MKTVRISDGDLVLVAKNGQLDLAEGLEKDGQDVANAILLTFDSTYQEGNDFYINGIGQVLDDPETAISSFISDAIKRVIFKRNLHGGGGVESIRQIQIESLNKTDFAFFVEVDSSNGTVGVVETLNRKPTKLDHLIGFDFFAKV